jgi:hypothetical protein
VEGSRRADGLGTIEPVTFLIFESSTPPSYSQILERTLSGEMRFNFRPTPNCANIDCEVPPMSPASLIAIAILSGFFSRDKSTPKCVTGQSIECACTDGRKGAQTCNERGTFDVCLCGATTMKGREPSQVCDPTGTWVFSGSSTDRKCKAKPIAETIIVTGGNGEWVVGSAKQLPWNVSTLKVDGPTCKMRITAQIDTCPSCRPAEDSYTFLADLTANSESVQGDVVVTHEPSYDDSERGMTSCVQSFKLHGKKRSLTDQQSVFDKVAAARKFQKFCKERAFENAFPWLEKHPKGGQVNAEIVIEPNGDLGLVKFDGQDQHLKDNLPERDEPFLEKFQPNPTGKRQTVVLPLVVPPRE